MTVYKADDFKVRQTAQRSNGYPCVEVVPPGSMAIFDMTAGEAMVLGVQLQAAADAAIRDQA